MSKKLLDLAEEIANSREVDLPQKLVKIKGKFFFRRKRIYHMFIN